MSVVLVLITVTLMLPVPTLMAASLAFATRDVLEMELYAVVGAHHVLVNP
jgi:hypothetical protein